MPSPSLRRSFVLMLLATLGCAKPSTTPAASPPASDAGPGAVPMGTSNAEAWAIAVVDGLVDPESMEVEYCGFARGGKPLTSGGRVDVLECVYFDTMAYVTAAWVLIRPSDRPDDLLIEELSMVTDVPGERGTYELGRLAVGKGRISIRAKERWVTHANTGEPDERPDLSTEKVDRQVTCELEPEYGWSCASE
jgi:hypothetical protein